MPDDLNSILEPVLRLSRTDIRNAALLLGDDEARYLVDAYYIMQEDRKRTASQERTLAEDEEPNLLVGHLSTQFGTLENQIKTALDIYTTNHEMGSWMREIYGIGPVISAGLLAHIYMGYWCAVCHGHHPLDCKLRQADKKRRLAPHTYQEARSCQTAGSIYQFAGIAGDGQNPWKAKTKRPHNAKLKTLCWKVGHSFMMFANHKECIYGHHYKNQKQLYIAKNNAGGFEARAKDLVATASPNYKKTDSYKHNLKGILSPGHIDAMARRWATKIFLSHLHMEWYERHFHEPAPAPYAIAILGHAHIDYSAPRTRP